MKKYIMICPHKCGSVILKKITSKLFGIDLKPDQVFEIPASSGKNQFLFSRALDVEAGEDDHIIIISRNPISISISMFYSFGYTHPRIEHIHGSKKEFEKMQNSITDQGLEEYVLEQVSKECLKIETLFNLKHPHKTILPYELMVDDFATFLFKLLEGLNAADSYEDTYNYWRKEFEPIKDRSKLIEQGKLKTHKRTTDTQEWKKKLSEQNLEFILKRHPFIKEYNSFI